MQLRKTRFSRVPKILIVEDDPDQRRLMAKIMQDTLGCETRQADDGLEALMLMMQDKQLPDLIILDLILPCINGVEFLKIIRGRPEFDHIPIVLCTAILETNQMRGVMGGWIHSYLVKPVRKDRLLEKVIAALHGIIVRVDYQD